MNVQPGIYTWEESQNRPNNFVTQNTMLSVIRISSDTIKFKEKSSPSAHAKTCTKCKTMHSVLIYIYTFVHWCKCQVFTSNVCGLCCLTSCFLNHKDPFGCNSSINNLWSCQSQSFSRWLTLANHCSATQDCRAPFEVCLPRHRWLACVATLHSHTLIQAHALNV